jgi:hypothetical protein
MLTPRIAFLLLAHNDAPHLERLCRILHPHSIFVHIDAKATGLSADKIAALPGVTVVKPSTSVHWGDFSVIEATLTLLKTARAAAQFDRYVLLSGGCYPARPLPALEAEFAADPSREWITLTPITPQSHLYSLIGRKWRMAPFVSQRSLDRQLRSVWNKISKMLGRDLASEIGMMPYFGSQWWALTDACVAMILEFVRSHPAFVRAYQSVYAPDEHFFQTIVGNSKFAASAIQVEDRGVETNKTTPLHLIATTSDRCFGSEEAEFAQVSTTECFFIRKVSTGRSGALLDRIDHELLGLENGQRAARDSASGERKS